MDRAAVQSLIQRELMERFQEPLRKLASWYAPSRYEEVEFSEKTLGEILDRYRDAMMGVDRHPEELTPLDVISGYLDSLLRDDDDYLYQEVSYLQTNNNDYKKLRREVWVSLEEELFSMDEDAFNEIFDETLEEPLMDELSMADTSVPLDVLERQDVEILIVPNLGKEGYLDGLSLDYTGVASSSLTVIPNDAFINALDFFGYTVEEYVSILEESGMTTKEELTHAVDEGEGSYRYQEKEKLAAMWRDALEKRPGKNPAKKVSPDGLIEILDNSSYGGVPAYACRVNLRQMLEHDWEKDLVLCGSQWIGLHDGLNGSGHFVSPLKGVEIKLSSIQEVYASSYRGYSIDETYGPVRSSLQVKMLERERTPEISTPQP